MFIVLLHFTYRKNNNFQPKRIKIVAKFHKTSDFTFFVLQTTESDR